MITDRDILGVEVRDFNFAVKRAGLQVTGDGDDKRRVDRSDTFKLGERTVSLDEALSWLNSGKLSQNELHRRTTAHASDRMSRGARILGGGTLLGIGGLLALPASPVIAAGLLVSAGAVISAGVKMSWPMR